MRCFKLFLVNPLNQSQLELNACSSGNAVEKAASGLSVITCSDSLSSAAEESVRGTMGRGKTGSSGSLCGGERF